MSRGGAGMKNHVLVGYQVFKKNQVRVESGSGSRKTLPENTCITSRVSLRLASTTADLIPYPFGSGIEEQIPVLPS